MSDFFARERFVDKFVVHRRFEILIFEDKTFDSHIKENIIIELATITTDRKNSCIQIQYEGTISPHKILKFSKGSISKKPANFMTSTEEKQLF